MFYLEIFFYYLLSTSIIGMDLKKTKQLMYMLIDFKYIKNIQEHKNI